VEIPKPQLGVKRYAPAERRPANTAILNLGALSKVVNRLPDGVRRRQFALAGQIDLDAFLTREVYQSELPQRNQISPPFQ
jgi:hypothetical protein